MGQQRTHMDEWASLLDEKVPDEIADARNDRWLGRDLDDSWSV